jgi:hypothetical protein
MNEMHTRSLLVMAFTTLAACAGGGAPANARDELATRNAPRREASLAPFVTLRVGNQQLLRHVAARTACVIDGATKLDFVTDPATGTSTFRGFAGGKVVTSEIGAAAAISDDGYYLTAAHCVSCGTALVFGSAGIGPVREVAAIVVWDGAREQPPVDLAVVWAPGIGQPPFDWSPANGTSPQPVVCCGSGARGLRAAGGNVVERDAAGHSCSVEVPLIPGDSGGPCALADGSLLGVVSTAQLNDGAPRGKVLRPDTQWLGELLARDRLARAGAPRPESQLSAAGTVRMTQIDSALDQLLPDDGRKPR